MTAIPIDKVNLSSTRVLLSLDRICSFEMRAMMPENNPFYLTCRQLQKNPNLSFECSEYYDFVQDFKPNDFSELHGARELKKYHIPVSAIFEPWTHSKPVVKIGSNSAPVYGFFGPKPASFVNLQVNKLKDLYRSIDQYGYEIGESQWSGTDKFGGYIVGQIFEHDGERRFRVHSGNHRVAVLLALKSRYPETVCKFREIDQIKPRDRMNNSLYTTSLEQKTRYPRIISSREASRWPAVTSGYMTSKDALKMFETFFGSRQE